MFVIRQSRAIFESSSALAFFFRQASRRASTARLMPTLLRYLKQSTTVLAGLVILTFTPEIRCSWMPARYALGEAQETSSWGFDIRGRWTPTGSMTYTLEGFSVVSSWKRRAESRQITALGERAATSARETWASTCAFGAV